jgi:NAD(P)-dependent dehydrogenase (short-subunit alcohol dehydrogenase family)
MCGRGGGSRGMDLGLGRQAVIVTGAASGIGKAIARMLVAEGVGGLVLTDRDAVGLEAAAFGMPAPVKTVVADLLDETAPQLIAAAAAVRFGRIDGLVNAAALTTRGSFDTGTPAVWDQLFAVNARAGFFLMQAAIADMRRRGAPGAIVNILSMNAHCGLPDLAIYAGTKGAMLTLTKNAAHAHMAHRIRVNGINLGWVATETEHRIQADLLGPDWETEVAATQPLGRLVSVEECARLATFLLSEASVPMSGAVIDLEQKVAGAI